MRKKDEMEQEIANKSIKIVWFATVMILFIIGIIKQFNSGERNIFLVIAGFSAISPWVLERFYLSRVNEDRSFAKMIALTIGFIAIMILVLWLSGRS